MQKGIEIYLYADDTALIISASNIVELQERIYSFMDKYCEWCFQNCIVINPIKSNYVLFFAGAAYVKIDNQNLHKPDFVKYLDLHIDDELNWTKHVKYVIKNCSQRIGLNKKALGILPKNVAMLYFLAFIKSSYSYCIKFWFGNERSGRCVLVNKIDYLIENLISKYSITCSNSLSSPMLCKPLNVYKMKCFSLMYDLTKGNVS